MQERLDAEVAERDTLAKQTEALRQAADSESAAAIDKLRQEAEECSRAARQNAELAQQQLAEKQKAVRSTEPQTYTKSTHCNDCPCSA